MAITYGGIALALSTPELDALQEAYLRRDQVKEFEGTYSSPGDLDHLPFRPLPPPSLKHLGRLYWPRDAARYAYGHFAVSDRILGLIRPLAYSGNELNSLTLTISDGTRSISTYMWMLPPRPISQINVPGVTGGNLWMMTLVDERYFWWYRAADIEVVEGTTTWNQLYNQIATGLGISLTIETVSPYYHKPTRRFTIADQPLPIMLDQVAYSVGQRIVRTLAGEVICQNFSSAKTTYDANYTAVTNRGFGGKFFVENTSSASGDMFALVPEEVRTVFPVQNVRTGEISDVYAIDNTLVSYSLPQYPSQVVGFQGRQVIWGDQIAHSSGGIIMNLSDLEDYASQISEDWYKWQTNGCDVSYSGVGDWDPEGITDSIDILYDSSVLTTRVQRGTWNDRSGGGLLGVAASGGIPDESVINYVTNVCSPQRQFIKLASDWTFPGTPPDDDTWYDIDTLSLTVTGVEWTILADVSVELSMSACSAGDYSYIAFRLYDVTASAAVTDSERMGVQSGLPNDRPRTNKTLTWFVYPVVQTEYQLQALCGSSGTPTVSLAKVKSDSYGWTHMFADPSTLAIQTEKTSVTTQNTDIIGDPVCSTLQDDCCPGGGSGGSGDYSVTCCNSECEPLPTRISITVTNTKPECSSWVEQTFLCYWDEDLGFYEPFESIQEDANISGYIECTKSAIDQPPECPSCYLLTGQNVMSYQGGTACIPWYPYGTSYNCGLFNNQETIIYSCNPLIVRIILGDGFVLDITAAAP